MIKRLLPIAIFISTILLSSLSPFISTASAQTGDLTVTRNTAAPELQPRTVTSLVWLLEFTAPSTTTINHDTITSGVGTTTNQFQIVEGSNRQTTGLTMERIGSTNIYMLTAIVDPTNFGSKEIHVRATPTAIDIHSANGTSLVIPQNTNLGEFYNFPDIAAPIIAVTGVSPTDRTNADIITWTFTVTDDNLDTTTLQPTDFATNNGGTVIANGLTLTDSSDPIYTYSIAFTGIIDGNDISLTPSTPGNFSISDTKGNVLSDTTTVFTDASTYSASIDRTPPTTTPADFIRTSGSTEVTNSTTLSWDLTFTETSIPVTLSGITEVNDDSTSDFELLLDGNVMNHSNFTIGRNNLVYTIAASNITLNGVYSLRFIGTVSDSIASNEFSDTVLSSQTYTVDRTPPILTITGRMSPPSSPSSIDMLVYNIISTKPLSATTLSDTTNDFTLSTDSNNFGTVANTTGNNYTLTYTGVSDASNILPELLSTSNLADAIGNEATLAALPNGLAITIDTAPPTTSTTAFIRTPSRAMLTNQANISWQLTFVEASNTLNDITEVTNAPTSDFILTRTRGGTGTDVTADFNFTVAKNNLVYTITVLGLAANGTDDGDYSLQLTRDVSDDAGNSYTTDLDASQTYTVDRTAPTTTSADFVRTSGRAELTNQASISWQLTFTEASGTLNGITEVTTSTRGNNNFILTRTRNGTGTDVTSQSNFTVTKSGLVYTITVLGLVSDGTDDGDYSLQLTRDVSDDAGNSYTTDLDASQTYTVDRTAPTTTSADFVRTSGRAELTNQARISWQLTFTEASGTLNGITQVTNASTSDFILTRGGTDITSTSNFTITQSGLVYTIEVLGLTSNDGTDDGIYTLRLTRDIEDGINTYTTDLDASQTYTVDRTAPTFQVLRRELPTAQTISTDDISWRVRVTDANFDGTTLEPSDFSLSAGTISGQVSGNTVIEVDPTNPVVSGEYIVKASNVSDANNIRLLRSASASGFSIRDLAGNELSITSGPDFTGATTFDALFSIDSTDPSITVTGVSPPTATRGNITWTFEVIEPHFDTSSITANHFTTSEGGDVGNLTPINPTNPPSSPHTYTIEFSNIGEGQNIRLMLATSISDTADPPNTLAPFTDPSTNVAIIDHTSPTFEIVGRESPTNQIVNTTTISWRVRVTDENFDSSTLEPSDFSLSAGTISGQGSGNTVIEVAPTNPPSDEYIVKATNVSDANDIRLLPSASGFAISDDASNTLDIAASTDFTGGADTGSLYSVDTTHPTITINPVRQGNDNRSNLTNLSWKVTFSEPVLLAPSNITPTGYATATPPTTKTVMPTTLIGIRSAEWTINFSGGDVTDLQSDNQIGFTLTNTNMITDAATNDLESANLGTNDFTFKVNGSDTVMTITRTYVGATTTPRSQHTNSRNVSWRISFTRDVPASQLSSLSSIFDVSSGTLSISPDAGQARLYTLTATGTTQSSVTLSLATSAAFNDERNIAVDLTNTSFTDTQYEFEDTEPSINTIAQEDPAPTNPADIVGPDFTNSVNDRVVLEWRVTFDELVTGITTSNFSVTGPGTVAIEAVTPSGSTEDLVHPTLGSTATFARIWDIRITDASGDGTTATTLTMGNVTDIIDRQGVSLASVTSGIPTYFVDSTPPTVTSIARTTQDRDNELIWTVTFDTMVENVTSSAFELRDSANAVIPNIVLEVDGTSPNTTYTIRAPANEQLLESRAESITLALTTPPALPTTSPTPNSAGIRDTAGNPLRSTAIATNTDNAIIYDPNHPSIVVNSVTPERNYLGEAIFEITLTGDNNAGTVDIDQSTIDPTDDFAIYEGATEITAASLEFVTNATPPVTTNNPIDITPTRLVYRIRASGLPVNTGLPARTFTLRSSSAFAIQDTSGNNIVDTAGGTDETGQGAELTGSDTNRVEILDISIAVTQTRVGDRIFTGTPSDTNNMISWLWTFTGSEIDESTIDTTTFTDFTISNSMTVSEVTRVGTNQIMITADADNVGRNGDGVNLNVHPQISGSFGIRTIYGKRLFLNNPSITNQQDVSATFTVDTDHPSIDTVVRLTDRTDVTTIPPNGRTSSLELAWLVTFDDPVKDFDASDVTITGFVGTVASASLSVSSFDGTTIGGSTLEDQWIIAITDTTGLVLPDPDPSRPAVPNKAGDISFTLGTSFTDEHGNAYLAASTPSSADYQFEVNTGEPVLSLTLDTDTPNTLNEAEWTLDFGEEVLISTVTLDDFTTTSGTLAIAPNPTTTSTVARTYKITVSGITDNPNADVPVQLGLNTNAGFTDDRTPTRDLVYSSFATALDFPSVIYTRDIHVPTIASVARQNPTASVFNIASGSTVTWRVTFDEEMFVIPPNPLNIDAASAIGTDDFAVVTTGITATITGADRDGTSNAWDITATLSDQTAPTATNVSLSLASGFAIVDDAGNALASDTASFTSAVYSVDISRPRVINILRDPGDPDPTINRESADARDNILSWYVVFNEPLASAPSGFTTTGVTGTETVELASTVRNDPTGSPYDANQVWRVEIDVATPHSGDDTNLTVTNITATDMRSNDIMDRNLLVVQNLVVPDSTITFDNTHPTISVTSVSPERNYVGTTEFEVIISGTELAGITDLDLSTITMDDFALAENGTIIPDAGVNVSINTPTPSSGNLVYTVSFTGIDVDSSATTERVLQLYTSANFAIADTSGNALSTATDGATPIQPSEALPNASSNELMLFNPDVAFTQTRDISERVFIATTGTISWTWQLSDTEILSPTDSNAAGYISADDFMISNGMVVQSANMISSNQIRITAVSDAITPRDDDDVRPLRSASFDIRTIYNRILVDPIVVNGSTSSDATYTVDTIRPKLTSIERVNRADGAPNTALSPADSFRQIFHWRLTFDDDVTGLTKDDIHLFGFTNGTTRVSTSSPIYGVFPTDSATLRNVWYVSVRNTTDANDPSSPSPLPAITDPTLILGLPNKGRPPREEPNTAGTIDFAQLLQGAVQDENNGNSDAATTIPRSTYQYNLDTSVVVASISLDSTTPNNSNSAEWSVDFTGPVEASTVTNADFSVPFGTLNIEADDPSATHTQEFTLTVSDIPDNGTADRVIRLALGTGTPMFTDDRPENVNFVDSNLDFAGSEYTYDTHPPEIMSVVRIDPTTQQINTSSNGTVQWRVTFSETMDPATITTTSFDVDTAAPELTGTVDTVTRVGNTDAWNVFVSLTDSRNTATSTRVTLTTGTTTITDDAGNDLNDIPARRTVDTAIYDADLVPPRLDRITRADGVPERSNELSWYIHLNEPIDPTTIAGSHFSRTGVTAATLSIVPLSPPPSGSAVNQVFHATVDVQNIPEGTHDGTPTNLVAGTLVFMDAAGNQIATQAPLQTTNEVINFDNDSPPLEVVSSDPERNYQGNTTFRIQFRQITDLNESTIDTTDFALAMSDGTLVPATITLGQPDRTTAGRLFYDITVSGVSVTENLQTLYLAASATFDITDNSGNPLFLTPERLIRQVSGTSAQDFVRVMFRNDNLSLAQTRDSSAARLFSANSGNLVWLITMTGVDEIDNPTSGAGQIESSDFVASNGFIITGAQLVPPRQIRVTAQHDGGVHNGDGTHFNVHINRSPTFDIRSNFLQPLPITISFDPVVDNTYIVDNDRPNIETLVRDGPFRQGNTDRLSWTITFDQPVLASSVTDNNDFAVSGYVPSTTPDPMAEALDDQNGFASEFRITVMGGDLMDTIPPAQDPDSIEPEGPVTISYSSPSITDMNGLSVDTTLPSSATTDPDPTNDAIGPPITYYVDENIASLASFMRPSGYTATDGSTVRITSAGVTASREWRWEAIFTKAIVPSSLSTEDFEITDGEILSVYPSDIDNLSFTIIARYDGDDNVAINISPTQNAQYTDDDRNQVVGIDLQAFQSSSVYELDITPPTINSLSRVGSSRVRQGGISWTITFDSPVVDGMIDDNTFAIDNDNNFTTTTSRVSASQYRVELTSNISGVSDREFRLSLVEPSDIIDLSGNVYIPTNFASFSRSSAYLLDTTDPRVESLYRIVDGTRATADPHISDSYYLTWAIEFSEPIINFDASDLNLSGSTNPLEISILGNTAIVRIANDPAPTASNGEVTLAFSTNFNIADIAGNNITTVTRGATIDTGSYLVDRTDPTVRVLSVRNASRTGVRVADAGDLVEVTIAIVGEPSPLIVPPMLTILGSTIRPLQFTSSFGNTYTTSFRVNSATPEGHLFFMISGGSDRAGNTVSPIHFVSDSNSGNEFTITLRTPPVVESIRRSLPVSGPISAESLTWLVEFSESVAGVASSDFQLERDGNAVTSIGNLRIEGAPNTAAYLVILDNIPSNLSAELGLSMSSSTGIVDISGVSLSSASPRISETYILRTSSSGLADAIPRLVVTVDKGGEAGFRQASPPIGVFPDTAPTMAIMNERITVTVTSTIPLSDSTLFITLSGSPITLTPNADRTIYTHTFPVTRDVPAYDGPIDITIDSSDYSSAGGVEGETLEVRSTVNSDNPNALGRPVGALTVQRPVRVLSHRRSLSGNEVTPSQNILWDVSFSSEVNNIDGSDYCVVTNSRSNDCTEYRVDSRVSRRASEAGSRYVYRVTARSPRIVLPIGTDLFLMLRSTQNIEDATTRTPLPNPTLGGTENESYELAATSNVIDPSGLSHTRRLVQNFITGRAKRILSSSPKLSDRFRPRRTGIAESWYSANFTDTTTEISYSGETDFGYTYSSLNQPILRGWIDTIYISSVDDTDKDESLMVHAGIDSHTSPNSIIGLLLQYDSTNRDFTDPIFGSQDGSNIKGDGWLVGPYHTINFGNSSTLESRVSYGRSKNSISPTGTYTDIFNTERYLGSIKYSGNLESGNLRVSPDLNYLYYLEKQLSYTDGLAARILPQDFHTHRLEFGPSFEHRYGYLLGDSIYSPYFSLYGIWDFEITEIDGTQEAPVSDITGRIDGGLRFTGLSGTDLDISGYYDGIGTELESYGVSFGIVINY